MRAVRTRKDGIVLGARSRFTSLVNVAQESVPGLDLLLGEAHFVAPKTLAVQLKRGETQHITAPLIFLDVGTRPEQPTIEGIESVPVLDSSSRMESHS
jgi:pyruvate/2-oxoglutarate dehydrogenase complex dihydrolipoamide dehydrogenase (E3) component